MLRGWCDATASEAPKSALTATIRMMVLAALLVSIISAVFAGAALIYYRMSAQAAQKSAVDASRSADAAILAAEAGAKSAHAAVEMAKLEAGRRHSELTPHFRIVCNVNNDVTYWMTMRVCLVGPPELERLDELTLVIRDYQRMKVDHSPKPGGPTQVQIDGQIWGPYRFVPKFSADSTGRTYPTSGVVVGDEIWCSLEPVVPPEWSFMRLTWGQWVKRRILLTLDCRKGGQGPWVLAAEVEIKDGKGDAKVPNLAVERPSQ